MFLLQKCAENRRAKCRKRLKPGWGYATMISNIAQKGKQKC